MGLALSKRLSEQLESTPPAAAAAAAVDHETPIEPSVVPLETPVRQCVRTEDCRTLASCLFCQQRRRCGICVAHRGEVSCAVCDQPHMFCFECVVAHLKALHYHCVAGTAVEGCVEAPAVPGRTGAQDNSAEKPSPDKCAAAPGCDRPIIRFFRPMKPADAPEWLRPWDADAWGSEE